MVSFIDYGSTYASGYGSASGSGSDLNISKYILIFKLSSDNLLSIV